MPRKTGPNDAARERSRAQLLQAGADLMLDQATQNPFAALRLRRLCEKAGLSTGAFYVHWATMEQYYDDLAEHLVQQRLQNSAAKVLQVHPLQPPLPP